MDEKYSFYKQEPNWFTFATKIRREWKLMLKICCMGTITGLVIAFGIPKEYTASAFLAHEGMRSRSFPDISELANMSAGMHSSIASEWDALYPSLYSAIVTSTPFLLQLSTIKVCIQGDSTVLSLAQYLKEYQKAPWWRTLTSTPSRLLDWCLSLVDEKPEIGDEIGRKGAGKGPLQLTHEEVATAGAIASRISIELDKKKRTITLSVMMQDPLVAAIVADTVQARLKAYMTEYRTSKSRRILAYSEKNCKEAQVEYHTAQDKYTRFVDANRNLTQLTSRAEQVRLHCEMELAQLAYNQAERQVQAAKARVEKVVPVYTVIQPVIIPLHPSSPNKLGILVGYILLSSAGGIGWILFAKDFVESFLRDIRRKRKTSEDEYNQMLADD
ncbi:chain-length determining protein [Bacteroides intestinalis]|uniref:chain-length determining protein n=1 Tax=Bacteroides intestinalis TaxID=329854 RepID=UPI001896FBAC|nr:chain-length determining protein [Bacteroides intestinalis]